MRLDAPTQTRNGARGVEQAEDSELLKRAQQGEMAAFEALVSRHQNKVFAMTARMLRSDDDAAEVVQEAFLAAYKHLPEFRGESAFGSWVYRIAANYALMRLRHRKVTAQVEEPEGSPTFNERGSLIDDVADWSRDAEEQTLDAELRKAIDDASARLPEEYRQVFLLRDVEGLSYEEIAQAVGDSVPAIKSRLHRARLALRAAIDRFYAERAS
jgi:RNA polymerase sigma-70 factor (ECF subfamily)